MPSRSPKNHVYTHFDEYPKYHEQDLGLCYSPLNSDFRVWSPTAEDVELRLYDHGIGDSPVLLEKMIRSTGGTWALSLPGDWAGKFYTFKAKINDHWLNEAVDVYAKAVGINGERAAIIDVSATNPENWNFDQRIKINNPSEIILYEIHVRDFSTDLASGILNKGKFLGFTEEGTQCPDGEKTGLDHLKELGITHVHLLPIFDFNSINEINPENKYNWGYDPLNYNVPEGTYSTDAYKPESRILEFKKLVQVLHNNGIGVIMDVVYNHTWFTNESAFNQIVPGYYYRHNYDGSFSNASGCGNETASERFMVRKFILDSVVFWANEYHLDGFRFDLMGIHDIETMNKISEELSKISPSIFVYGEPWAADRSPLPDEMRALKHNTPKLKHISVFNDDFRDAVKGKGLSNDESGFIGHQAHLEETIKFGIVGAIHHPQIDYGKVRYSHIAWSLQPYQCINYVSCHDNHTLWDKIQLSSYGSKEIDRIKMYKLAVSLVLTSQGIPFLHGGTELMISKKGDHNSYQSPDDINQLKWGNKAKFKDIFNYIAGLIGIRKKHPAFRLNKKSMVIKHLRFIDAVPEGVVAYIISEHANHDSWKNIVVIFNSTRRNNVIPIPDGAWTVVATHEKISENGLTVLNTNNISVPPISMMILVSSDSI